MATACSAIATLLVASSGWAQDALERPVRKPVETARGRQGIVVSDTPLASEVGRDILARGGNAVDAAVATALALAVTWPEAGNIGGGGFMLIAPPKTDDVICINYRETSPSITDANSFRKWKNRSHPRMAGVPGTVLGLATAHQNHGHLAWRDLVAPSIALAKEGVTVDGHLAYSLNSVLQSDSIRTEPRYREFRRVYGHPDGRPWRSGDRLTQPDLAATLQRISDHGADAFYKGTIADQIVAEMQRGDGLITAADLQAYTCTEQSAVSGRIQGLSVYGAPLPSSGGATVLMQLRMLDACGIQREPDAYWTVQQVHTITEVMRRAFRERAAHMGDPAMVSIDPTVFDDSHARELASQISPKEATPSAEIAGGIPLTEGPYESTETTHFSVIDGNGMAVSNTFTLEATYGSRIVVGGAGFLLNNEMGDFNWYPGYTNTEGTIGTPPNRIAPGKRMLSSQSPTIVKRDGNVVLVVGSPGGRTIINTVTQIIVQNLFFKRSLAAAVDGPRFHHQWFPDLIQFEGNDHGLFSRMTESLLDRGHAVRQRTGRRQGSVHAIAVDLDSGEAIGVADWRRGGAARSVSEP